MWRWVGVTIASRPKSPGGVTGYAPKSTVSGLLLIDTVELPMASWPPVVSLCEQNRLDEVTGIWKSVGHSLNSDAAPVTPAHDLVDVVVSASASATATAASRTSLGETESIDRPSLLLSRE